MHRAVITLLIAAAAPLLALADIHGQELGTAPPSAQIGGWDMHAAPFDSRLFQDVLSCPDVLGGDISFDRPANCRQVGTSWGTWSHPYTGNVYWIGEDARELAVTFMPGTKAVSFYLEPQFGLVFDFTIVGSDGLSTVALTESIDGFGGAAGFAFYTDGPGDVAGLHLTSNGSFAIGEFATGRAVPAPPAILAAVFSGIRRRRPT